jgi:hypothetical protein
LCVEQTAYPGYNSSLEAIRGFYKLFSRIADSADVVKLVDTLS